MRFTIKTNVSLDSTEDCLQSKTILSAVTFDENKKRNQIIYYKDIEQIEPNKPVTLTSLYPYVGFILVKFSKVDRKWLQYPIILIDTRTYVTEQYIVLSSEFVKSLPFGSIWKRSLQYDDFVSTCANYVLYDEIYYFNTEDLKYLVTDEDGNSIIFDL